MFRENILVPVCWKNCLLHQVYQQPPQESIQRPLEHFITHTLQFICL